MTAYSSAELRAQGLLEFACRLQRARSFAELLSLAAEEVRRVVGYESVWFMVAENAEVTELRLLEVSDGIHDLAWEVAPVLKVAGDRFLEELTRSTTPVVIEDARTDPRTDKAMVERLANRTIVNMPLLLLDKPFGIFGTGTFGDEGCRPPSAQQLDYLVGMANQLAVAAARIRYSEATAKAEEEQRSLDRRLAHVQRLDSLGMLAGGIAHDFNNLLTVIIASATMAEQDTQDEPVRQELNAILAAAGRAKDLTMQLLAMSRTQALEVQPIDICSAMRRLVELARRIFPATVTIELRASGRPLVVEGDASRLDQVFLNLLINARDAMPSGGQMTLEVESEILNGSFVEVHPWATPGRYVAISLSDTGVGMPPEVQERLFEPFFTTKGPQKGTGLGLAVSYGIIKQHRGHIHCYSEVGTGTCFKVYLPEVDAAARDSYADAPAAVPGKRERVLVVDDDPLLRAVAVRALERAEYQAVAAENGGAACAAFAQEPFDAVLLDIVMPGMTCGEVIERIQNARPDVPIVLMSGYTSGENVGDLLRHTRCPLLRKPYDPASLVSALRAAIDGAPFGAGQGGSAPSPGACSDRR